MLVQQFVDEGLGNSSYLIVAEESGLAAVVDPQRDVERYLQAAEGMGLRIAYALDTHLHNDFVSGAREIAAATRARAAASAEAELDFEHLALRDGDFIELGEVVIKVLATPGHTPEHISFSANEAGVQTPEALFTGGALITGGAARTDLLGEENAIPLAHRLFHSIHDKLLAYPDETRLYPTHGAGSFCAAPAVTERSSTIGRERSWNPLVRARDEEEFVARALSGLPSYPAYFKQLRRINQHGPALLGGVPRLKPLSPEEVSRLTAESAAVVDVRRAEAFGAGHVPGSYGIPLETPLSPWAGWVIPFGSALILVGESEAERTDAVRQLIRIGYDDLRGYLEGGMQAWEAEGNPTDRVERISAQELARRLASAEAPAVLDVRSNAEWQSGHIPGALHIEAGDLPLKEHPIPEERLTIVHCAHANRSTVSISVLKQRGYKNIALLRGGFFAWQTSGYPVTKPE